MSKNSLAEAASVAEVKRGFDKNSLPPGLRQFIKFCIVGISSTFIDWTVFFLVYNYLIFPSHVGATVLEWFNWSHGGRQIETGLSNIISFSLGVANGFYWHTKWTFRGVNANNRRKQFFQFLIINIIGLGLNTGIVILATLPFQHPDKKLPFLVMLFAKCLATGIVLFWNFFANKFWTFKQPNSNDTEVNL